MQGRLQHKNIWGDPPVSSGICACRFCVIFQLVTPTWSFMEGMIMDETQVHGCATYIQNIGTHNTCDNREFGEPGDNTMLNVAVMLMRNLKNKTYEVMKDIH